MLINDVNNDVVRKTWCNVFNYVHALFSANNCLHNEIIHPPVKCIWIIFQKPNCYRNIRRGKWQGFQTGLARTLHTTGVYLHKRTYIIHVYRIPALLHDSRGSNFQRRYKSTFFYYSLCPSQSVNKRSDGFIIVTRCNMKRVFEKDSSPPPPSPALTNLHGS